MKIKFIAVCTISLCFLTSLYAHETQEKRIYLVDMSGSMAGKGTVETSDVLSKVKTSLLSTISWTPVGASFVIIPFTDRLYPEISGSSEDKTALKEKVSKMVELDGNTDLMQPWKAGILQLDSTKVNYLFLITDGLHNRGAAKDQVVKMLSEWPEVSEGYDAEAYYVVIDSSGRKSYICSIFDSKERMHVVESMKVLRGDTVRTKILDQNQSDIDEIKGVEKSCAANLSWLLYASIILLLLLLIGVILYYCGPIIANMFSFRMKRFFIQHIKQLSGVPKSNGKWTGEKGNSRWIPQSDYIPEKGGYFNQERKTWESLLNENGIDGIDFKNGVPDFSPISKFPVRFNWLKELDDRQLQDLLENSQRKDIHEAAYRKMAEKYGKTVEEIKRIKESLNLVPHERIDGTIELVPRDIHDGVSHHGGINVFQEWYRSRRRF